MKYLSLLMVCAFAFAVVGCTLQPRPEAKPEPQVQVQPTPETEPTEQNEQPDTEELQEELPEDLLPESPQGPNRESTSQGNIVVLNNFGDRSILSSPMRITGAVPSAWVFEGIFPVEIRTDSGELVEEWYAEASLYDEDGELIEGLVPFVINLDFTVPAPERATEGILRLMADTTLAELPDEERDMLDIMVLFE